MFDYSLFEACYFLMGVGTDGDGKYEGSEKENYN